MLTTKARRPLRTAGAGRPGGSGAQPPLHFIYIVKVGQITDAASSVWMELFPCRAYATTDYSRLNALNINMLPLRADRPNYCGMATIL